MVAFKANRSVHLRARSDNQRMPFLVDAAPHAASYVHFIAIKKYVAAQMPVHRQRATKHGHAAPDFPRGIHRHCIAEPGNVFPQRPGDDRGIPRRAYIAVDRTANPQIPAGADHVSGHVPVDIDIFARRNNIAVHRAFHAHPLTDEINVPLDRFILADRWTLSPAMLRRRNRRRQCQHGAEPREDQRQRRSAPDPPPEQHCSQSRQRHHRQHFEEGHHGLPSFPHCALKNQQAQQVRTTESRLFQLMLPRLDISRIKCVDSRCRQAENHSPNPLHGFPGAFLKLRQPRG